MDIVEIKSRQWQRVKINKKYPQPLLKHKIFTESKRKKTLQKSRIYSAILPAPLSFLDVNRRPEKSE